MSTNYQQIMKIKDFSRRRNAQNKMSLEFQSTIFLSWGEKFDFSILRNFSKCRDFCSEKKILQKCSILIVSILTEFCFQTFRDFQIFKNFEIFQTIQKNHFSYICVHKFSIFFIFSYLKKKQRRIKENWLRVVRIS